MFVCKIIITYTRTKTHITLCAYTHRIDMQTGMRVYVNDYREGFRVLSVGFRFRRTNLDVVIGGRGERHRILLVLRLVVHQHPYPYRRVRIVRLGGGGGGKRER